MFFLFRIMCEGAHSSRPLWSLLGESYRLNRLGDMSIHTLFVPVGLSLHELTVLQQRQAKRCVGWGLLSIKTEQDMSDLR